jgi:uncharacterized protein YecE (DUF72 family)
VRIRAGSSGYAYKEWREVFYPAELNAADYLDYYATQLDTVEINNTFYRMPRIEVLERWRAKVTPEFVFALKASRRITHQCRLKDSDESVAYLWSKVRVLGDSLGPILFQLPPSFKKNVERLDRFLGVLPDGMRAAIEFRHASWFDEDVFSKLRSANLCLCHSDEGDSHDLVSTADFGYIRLRRENYTDAQLQGLAQRVNSQEWADAFCFFKHEEGGAAPQQARRFADILGQFG